MSVFRVYVEKKKEFAVKAKNLKNDINNVLNIDLKDLRIINRYDIEGTSEDKFLSSIPHIFAEPSLDDFYFDLKETTDYLVALEYLPGQYDQRGDSAAQCFQLYHKGKRPVIKTATIYIFTGELSLKEKEDLKNYLINPIESREASLALPTSLDVDYMIDENIPEIKNFITLDENSLTGILEEYSLSMSLDDLKVCQEYFHNIKRNPNLAEIRILDTYWSDHCRHTTFLTKLTNISIKDPVVEKTYRKYLKMREFIYRDNIRAKTLMDMGTIGAKELKRKGLLNDLDESKEINACSVKVKVDVDGEPEDYLFMFKNETHNHPTEIEPFGGAATCLGGAIRDPLSGRSYVYQGMRVTGCGGFSNDTLPGKLSQRKISTSSALGFSSYGNQIGLATGLVEEIYHPGYVAKRMEVGAVLGAVPLKNVKRTEPLKGDVVVLLGGKTGKDGCGGATGSSKSHDLKSLSDSGAEVQKGNPVEERKLQRLFRNPDFARLIKRCNDFGAGGVSVAVGELADSLNIDLDAVPKKYLGLNGIELAISESQERMAVVVEKDNLPLILQYAMNENIEGTKIAEVTDDGYLRMFWQGKEIVSLERKFLDSNGASRTMEVVIPEYEKVNNDTVIETDFIKLMADYNICSKKGLGELFDSTIGGGSVLMPYGGEKQLTPIQAMAARFPVLNGSTNTCSVFAYGFDPYLSSLNPYLGAYTSVIHSVAKAVATGGSIDKCWLSFQEYFPKLSDDPAKWGMVASSLLGALEAQLSLNIGAIGGKDSMSGTFNDLEVPPTLISFAASVGDFNNIKSPEFKEAGNKIVYITIPKNDDGIFIEEELRKTFKYIEELRIKGFSKSVYALGKGGIAEGISKMSFGNEIGFKLTKELKDEDLFKMDYGSFLVEVENNCDDLKLGEIIGLTTTKYELELNGKNIKLGDIENSWKNKLEPIFSTKHDSSQLMFPLKEFKKDKVFHHTTNITKPKVIVPVFPGTNCEYDTIKALKEAGADASTFIINNLSPSSLEESIDALEKLILKSQMLVLPGGFSGGDEPDGSAKLIASFFRNPKMEEAIMTLLYKNDGLICGICNGFQALLKLGLVPYGKIVEETSTSPSLTFNLSGKHQSSLIRTKILSNNSPWLSDFKVGNIYTLPVSHGEGRFVASEEEIQGLSSNGQIATVYVDDSGKETGDFPYNPNGSSCGIEGILSPDGRIYGRMAHSERYLNEVYINVPGNKKMDIFSSGIKYFR